jgi:F-type H+-transporting ATPase subunit b
MRKLFFILALLLSANILAAGGGKGSPLDLKMPFLNFFLLFGTLAYMLRGKLSAMFTQNSKEVAFQFEASEKKSKEAAIKLEMYQKKIADIPLEEKKIIQDAENEVNRFQDSLVKKNKDYINRLQKEVENRLTNEEKRMEMMVRNQLADSIINQVKDTIKNNSANVNKVNQKLLAKVRS